MLLSGITPQARQSLRYARMLDGSLPVYTSTKDVYSYDIVRSCIDCIATEISKLQPHHIRDEQKRIVPGPINTVLASPNPLMTTRDFLEKIVWTLYLNYNAFIYPQWEGTTLVALYPLAPTQVTFQEDGADKLFVQFYFASGATFTLPYDDVIHIRKQYSANELMGGSTSGRPDNTSITTLAQVNDIVTEGLGKAVKASLSVRGIIKLSSVLDDDLQRAERRRFEENIAAGTTAIVPVDLKGDFTPIAMDPKVIDKDTMEFLERRILSYYGVPAAILSGDFTDQQYEAFQEKTLNPIIASLNQAFTKALFTQTELAHGNRVQFYNWDLQFMSVKTRLDYIKTLGEQGLLTDDQKLALFGLPPIPGGDRITQSLNYINRDLVDRYQLQGGKTQNA